MARRGQSLSQRKHSAKRQKDSSMAVPYTSHKGAHGCVCTNTLMPLLSMAMPCKSCTAGHKKIKQGLHGHAIGVNGCVGTNTPMPLISTPMQLKDKWAPN